MCFCIALRSSENYFCSLAFSAPFWIQQKSFENLVFLIFSHTTLFSQNKNPFHFPVLNTKRSHMSWVYGRSGDTRWSPGIWTATLIVRSGSVWSREANTPSIVNILPQQSHTTHHHASTQGLATVLLCVASAQETHTGAWALDLLINSLWSPTFRYFYYRGLSWISVFSFERYRNYISLYYLVSRCLWCLWYPTNSKGVLCFLDSLLKAGLLSLTAQGQSLLMHNIQLFSLVQRQQRSQTHLFLYIFFTTANVKTCELAIDWITG